MTIIELEKQASPPHPATNPFYGGWTNLPRQIYKLKKAKFDF
jgi:hypothetical protein